MAAAAAAVVVVANGSSAKKKTSRILEIFLTTFHLLFEPDHEHTPEKNKDLKYVLVECLRVVELASVQNKIENYGSQMCIYALV